MFSCVGLGVTLCSSAQWTLIKTFKWHKDIEIMNVPKKVRKYYLENRILSLTRVKPVVSCFGMDGIFILWLAFYAAMCNRFV